MVIAAACFVIVLGAGTAVSWLLHPEWHGAVLPFFLAMKFNTSTMFVGAGFGLLAAWRGATRPAFVAGVLVVLFGCINLVQYLGLNLRIDEALVSDVLGSGDAYPGRMALNTALAFVFAGLFIIFAAVPRGLGRSETARTELLALLVFSLGVEGILEHLPTIKLAYRWVGPIAMATPTAIGFLGLGVGMMALSWRRLDRGLSRTPGMAIWVPGLICLAVLMVDLATPAALATDIFYIPIVLFGLWYVRPRAVFVFAGIGSVLALLAAFAQPPGDTPTWILAMNRVLIVCAIWFVAVLVYLHRNGEISLQKSEERTRLLATMVESSDDAIIGETLKGNIIAWNGGAERLFGYRAAEMIGQHVNMLIPADLREQEERNRFQLQQGRNIPRFETRRSAKGGRDIDVSITLSPIRDQAGTIVGASKIAHDISERHRADEKFRLAVESIPKAIVMIDNEGRVALVNNEAETLFGYARNELNGKSMEMLVPDRFRGAHPGHRSGFVSAPSARAMGPGRDLYGRRKDGSEFPVEIRLNPIQGKDGLIVLSVIDDLTERIRTVESLRLFNEKLEHQVVERTVQLQAANRELEEFAYAASHDLKAPLRVIDNASKWLEEDLQPHLTPETRENMNLLRGRIKRMEKLLDDLLEYSRVGRQRDDRNVEEISGTVLMDNILMMLSPPDGFEVRIGAGFAGISVKRMPLQQVLMNLISNAIRHHDRKSGYIEVDVEERGANYAFSVKDDGPGIDPRFHEQIFKMFQTLKPKDQVEGSGMGLAMVRKNVEVYGGTVDLESAAGKGSVFRFTWPKHDEATEQAA
ncbi:MAG: hypothetical protein JWM58_2 [Rhizobium sp.]|nr:hypothetical protein [Rhizobium sp.]